MKTVAFIFARGGSKGIPKKNLQLLGERSLLGHAVRAAKDTSSVSRVIVSTDCEEIAEEAIQHGADVPFMRPPQLASSSASEWDAWQHAVSHPEVGDFDVFLSVPATAPLRTSVDLDVCLSHFRKGGSDIVVTGTESARSPYFNLVKQGCSGHVEIFAKAPTNVTRRQDAPSTYDLTTVAYVSSPDYVLNSTGVLAGRVGLVCVPRNRALDIDEPTDLELARFLYERPELLGGEAYSI